MSLLDKMFSNPFGDYSDEIKDASKRLTKTADRFKSRLGSSGLTTQNRPATENLTESRRTHPVYDTPEAPPASPTPKRTKPLSVMIAVNGVSYGPYDRDSLLGMIDNGSLTKETYVYMNGMSNWKAASEVAEVAELFSSPAPLPPLPPVPPGGSLLDSSDDYASGDDILSPKLNRLIEAAVADGEISDGERQVLIRNAQAEGVPVDEVFMILDAKLYERRRALETQGRPAAHRASENRALKKKCPHCGAPVKVLSTNCPECGYDYLAPVEDTSASAIEKLNAALEEVDNEKSTSLMGAYMSLMGQKSNDPEKINKKKRIIENFPVPSDKKGIFDFFVAVAPLAKSSFLNRSGLEGAYKKKASQILSKARVMLKGDPEIINEIEKIAKEYKIK